MTGENSYYEFAIRSRQTHRPQRPTQSRQHGNDDGKLRLQTQVLRRRGEPPHRSCDAYPDEKPEFTRRIQHQVRSRHEQIVERKERIFRSQPNGHGKCFRRWETKHDPFQCQSCRFLEKLDQERDTRRTKSKSPSEIFSWETVLKEPVKCDREYNFKSNSNDNSGKGTTMLPNLNSLVVNACTFEQTCDIDSMDLSDELFELIENNLTKSFEEERDEKYHEKYYEKRKIYEKCIEKEKFEEEIEKEKEFEKDKERRDEYEEQKGNVRIGVLFTNVNPTFSLSSLFEIFQNYLPKRRVPRRFTWKDSQFLEMTRLSTKSECYENHEGTEKIWEDTTLMVKMLFLFLPRSTRGKSFDPVLVIEFFEKIQRRYGIELVSCYRDESVTIHVNNMYVEFLFKLIRNFVNTESIFISVLSLNQCSHLCWKIMHLISKVCKCQLKVNDIQMLFLVMQLEVKTPLNFWNKCLSDFEYDHILCTFPHLFLCDIEHNANISLVLKSMLKHFEMPRKCNFYEKYMMFVCMINLHHDIKLTLINLKVSKLLKYLLLHETGKEYLKSEGSLSSHPTQWEEIVLCIIRCQQSEANTDPNTFLLWYTLLDTYIDKSFDFDHFRKLYLDVKNVNDILSLNEFIRSLRYVWGICRKKKLFRSLRRFTLRIDHIDFVGFWKNMDIFNIDGNYVSDDYKLFDEFCEFERCLFKRLKLCNPQCYLWQLLDFNAFVGSFNEHWSESLNDLKECFFVKILARIHLRCIRCKRSLSDCVKHLRGILTDIKLLQVWEDLRNYSLCRHRTILLRFFVIVKAITSVRSFHGISWFYGHFVKDFTMLTSFLAKSF